jgi:Fe-S-cluster containining protein
LSEDDKYSIKKLCSSCTHQQCCTGFDAPIVFPEDRARLEQNDKATSEYLEDVIIVGTKLEQIRKKPTGECVFWNNKCEIYDYRPFDCRIFPFDIDYIDGEFYWIVYSCNKDSDWHWAEEHLRHLEQDPMWQGRKEYLMIFNEAPYSYPEKVPYTVLRKVNFQ